MGLSGLRHYGSGLGEHTAALQPSVAKQETFLRVRTTPSLNSSGEPQIQRLITPGQTMAYYG